MSKAKIEAFPELRIEHLRLYAEEWVQDYPAVPIERITLYRFDNPWALHIKHRRSSKGEKVNPRGKYACVVDFSESASLDFERLYGSPLEITTPFGRAADKVPNSPEGTEHSQEEGGLDTDDPRGGPFNALAAVKAREKWLQSLSDCEEFIINEMGYPHAKDGRFATILRDVSFKVVVYRHPPDEEFFHDWVFIPRTAKQKPIEEHFGYIKCNRPHFILFQTDKRKTAFNKKKQELMLRAIPEIERLYSVVKGKGIGVNPKHEFPDEILKEAMLKKLSIENFELIKAEYLEIKGCYTWTPTQEKRSFFSFMTNVILEANGLGKINVAAVEKMRKNLI